MLKEADIQRLCLERLRWWKGGSLWRANVGAHTIRDPGRRPRFMRFGRPGQADLTGILAGSGRRLEVEIKTSRGVLSERQRDFAGEIQRMGGLYAVVRSADELEGVLDEWTGND